MQAPDLTVGAPRRWSENIEGIVWLPRLIDKTRAAHAGTLGSYLFGQSPVDRSLLRALGIGYTDFARIVACELDDAAIVRSIAHRDPESLARARKWGAWLQKNYGWFLFVLDVDDGYAGGFWRAVRPPVTACANAFTWFLKRAWPSKAIERSKRG
ncbi:MAG: DUF5069 domain-containing protein [Candidatus Eremiobacteraeota bacterium]|nr:DUF5069 domain-containing protein [Candidatus Eremiobacteraeota bacterium]